MPTRLVGVVVARVVRIACLANMWRDLEAIENAGGGVPNWVLARPRPKSGKIRPAAEFVILSRAGFI